MTDRNELRRLAESCLRNGRAQINMPDHRYKMEIGITDVISLLDENASLREANVSTFDQLFVIREERDQLRAVAVRLKDAIKDAWSEGYSDGLGDGHPLSGISHRWKDSEAAEVLADPEVEKL